MPSYGAAVRARHRAAAAARASSRTPRRAARPNSGLDFFVPITDEDGDPVTLAADDYYVGFFGIAGSTTLPMPEFPPGAGTNRTTTQFRVQVNAAPTAGDVWLFQIVER
jgi:hypothetical protein